MVRHNFSVWREPVEDGWGLWAKCTRCSHEVFARNYDDLAVGIGEHQQDMRDLAALEHEERAHS